MKRITITLPDDLARAAEREARERDGSLSGLVRDALASHLAAGSRRRRLPFAALGGSGHRNAARDVEEILAREWTDARRS